ncbi:MAG: excinuclease ABC subunit A [Bacteroidetes bacterium]|nr:MAG: excinuclease ABC subunit A [Bacteroidota bacterium]
MAKGTIDLRGVRVNNLHIEELSIPRRELVVLTGLSGSGKSSLAFETLYAEGQRRYVQSMTSYARQFLGRMPKPDADYIGGIPPSIVIEQRVSNRNPRSTVGTSSEVYEYLRLLFARVGKIISPISGEEVKCHTVDDVVRFLAGQEGKRVVVLAPLNGGGDSRVGRELLEDLASQGYSRVYANEQFLQIDGEESRKEVCQLHTPIYLLVDRFVASSEPGAQMRVSDSVEAAFRQGDGACRLLFVPKAGRSEAYDFSVRLELDGLTFQRPSPNLFSFNNAMGACPTCEGYGMAVGIDEDRVIPDKNRSIYDDAVVCWRGNTMRQVRDEFIMEATKVGFPIHRPYFQLTDEQRAMVWDGIGTAEGIYAFFEALKRQNYKVQNRVMISRYTGKTLCPTCHGRRLRDEALWVRVAGHSISEMVDMPLHRLKDCLDGLQLDEHDMAVAKRLLQELRTRLQTLVDVGLGYLTLNRLSKTLSGGETQRINLATSLGSSLVGSLYILDEPSVGLHPQDTRNLVAVLERLRDKGNTVLVVEHDEDVMRAADTIIDMGPGAGRNGGGVMYVGPLDGIDACPDSLTGAYLSGRESIPLPSGRSEGFGELRVEGVVVNNLKGVDVRIPLGALTVVTGVSGSGKSSLINVGVKQAVESLLEGYDPLNPTYRAVELRGGELTAMEIMDQNPLSRSTRSTPVTYIGSFDRVRSIFANEEVSKRLGLGANAFSFNSFMGACEECSGAGVVVVEMQFMADIEVPCEACHGMRYKPQVLDALHRGKNIHEVLQMTVDEAVDFFRGTEGNDARQLVVELEVLQEVGLGYVQLGQSTSTLSGGEAQRLKLASYLLRPKSDERIFFMFDEPTTGLHIHDIRKLVHAFRRLVELGHTIVVIEHNVELMRQADWMVDMGPGAGEYGGHVVFMGTPEELALCEQSATARFLKDRL